MLFVTRADKWLGWVLTVVPLALFLILSAYVWFATPADQSGWGDAIFVAMTFAAVLVPAALFLLPLGYLVAGPRRAPRSCRSMHGAYEQRVMAIRRIALRNAIEPNSF
jgi:hypothetical protein